NNPSLILSSDPRVNAVTQITRSSLHLSGRTGAVGTIPLRLRVNCVHLDGWQARNTIVFADKDRAPEMCYSLCCFGGHGGRARAGCVDEKGRRDIIGPQV